jgi:ADP-ribose pyrophosphatase YjhB (NUDIX family)
LIVQETEKHNKLWWLPGGRVEHGDSFLKTALKETKEEGGIDVVPSKLLKVCSPINYFDLFFASFICRLSKVVIE